MKSPIKCGFILKSVFTPLTVVKINYFLGGSFASSWLAAFIIDCIHTGNNLPPSSRFKAHVLFCRCARLHLNCQLIARLPVLIPLPSTQLPCILISLCKCFQSYDVLTLLHLILHASKCFHFDTGRGLDANNASRGRGACACLAGHWAVTYSHCINERYRCLLTASHFE